MNEYHPISALQHLLFCERQCALIHVEREWRENRFTAEGRVLHRNAHDGPSETRPGVRVARGMWVAEPKLGLSGQCDVVEFHRDGRIVPVEYKRGKPKAHRADEVQLCAQACALEAMFNVTVNAGFLYYGTPRRRTEVAFDTLLRGMTQRLAVRLREVINNAILPKAVYERRKCAACSLYDLCQPKGGGSARHWFEQRLTQKDDGGDEDAP